MPTQQPLPFAPFRNEGLFTDHYLQDVLPDQQELWRLDGLADLRAELQTLWQDQSSRVEDYNEAQLEEHFIKPVLSVLGHTWEVQPRAGSHQPDYGFFPDESARDLARAEEDGSQDYWRHAVAVGDAKVWDLKLDKALTGGSGWDFQNPSFQIYYYLAETGCRWAILTNGRTWRLYSSHPRANMQVFYEVDLPAALESDDPEALAYFWLFFRQAAFVPDADGDSFLQRVQAESDLAAERLREDVRDRVYRALLESCRGFADAETDDLPEDRLKAIYDNALVFLYRLLFILYAESGDLLPVRENDRYRDRYSLQAIEAEVHEDASEFLSGMTTLWPRLQALAGVIDQGNADLGVPAYNGGLFDPARHSFLEDNHMSDARVARVLGLLARTDEGARIDFRDLGVRHLGSIYEGLLEYSLAQAEQAMVVVRQKGRDLWVPADADADEAEERCEPADLYLVTDRGERKAMGSYYTPQFIVEHIVENTLGPLIERCEGPEEILALNVLDPAMGSGHFLVEATNYLAHHLIEKGAATGRLGEAVATLGAEEAEDEADMTAARRLVVERCIFGVDLNPLAVELAKLSLWLDTVAKGQPLSFLDHHLRCGDSLIGAQVDRLPTPPHAQSADEQADSLFDEDSFAENRDALVSAIGDLTDTPSHTREDVHQKEERLAVIDASLREPYRRIADLWCSHFFGHVFTGRTYSQLVQHFQGNASVELLRPELDALERSEELAARYRFFHWELEFPEVFFDEDGRRKQEPGFDAVIGNPPWERIKLQQVEFFGRRAPEIALAPTAARRKAMIEELSASDPDLWREYQEAQERAERVLAWTRTSGQFPLMGRGDTNLYAVMTERGRDLLCAQGRLGFLVPSGIATDKTTSDFFRNLVETRTLATLLDFENRQGVFADVHRSFKFSVIVFSGGEEQADVPYGCFLHGPDDMADPERVFTLQTDDFLLMNPNTGTCPVFRTGRDAEITRAIYSRAPVLVRETDEGDENPWGIRYFTMFHMTNDSDLFRTGEELLAEGCYPVEGNRRRRGEELYLPLYEGKMVQMYDHRAANVVVDHSRQFRPASPEPASDEEHADPSFSPTPQFWVSDHEVTERVGDATARWSLSFKDVTAPSNQRTMVCAAVPQVAAGNNLPLLVPTTGTLMPLHLLLANLASMAFDFVARQKVGGQHLNFFIVQQLAVLLPERYEEDFAGVPLADFVNERVLELTYTAHDMAGFAEDMGYVDEEGAALPPFAWDEERRLHLRCQLDALYFHLYGLNREDADYILETFPIVKRHDEEQFGRYRTKDLILHYFNAYAAGDMDAWVTD